MSIVEAVTAALGIGDKVAGIVQPRFQEDLAQRYNKEYETRITNIQNILNHYPVDRDALNGVVCECLTAAGYPVAPVGLADQTIEVPLGDFVQLFAAAADDARKTQTISSILTKNQG